MAWIPLVVALIGAGAGALKNRGKNNPGPMGPEVDPGVPPIGPQGGYIFEQGSPYWPGSVPRFANSALTGGGGGGGGGGSSAMNTSTSTTVSDMTQIPVITPEFQKLLSLARGDVEGRLGRPTSLPLGYTANNVANINDGFRLTNQAIANRLTDSGLSGSPAAAAAMAGGERERGKQITGFLNNIPMVERDLRDQDIETASRLIANFGRGQNTKSKSTTKTQSLSKSSGGGGGGGAAAPQLGDFLAQQYFQGPQKQQDSGWFDKTLGYALTLATLYAQLKSGGGAKGGTYGGQI